MKKKFSILKISAIMLFSLLFSIILLNNDALAASQPIGSLKYPIGLGSEYIIKYEDLLSKYQAGNIKNISIKLNKYSKGSEAQNFILSKWSGAPTATSSSSWHVYNVTFTYHSSSSINEAIDVSNIINLSNLYNTKGESITPLAFDYKYVNNGTSLSSAAAVAPKNSLTFNFAVLLNNSNNYPILGFRNYYAPENPKGLHYAYYSLDPTKINK